MIPILSIVGHHDSGKTRLVATLIPLLIERGYRVGTVKHAPHLEHVDEAETDSATHLEAGAARVLLHGERASALFWRRQSELSSAEIDQTFFDCDLVLVEGMKAGPFPKIEVFRRGRDLRREPLAGELDVCAVVTSDHVALPDGVVLLSPRRTDAIVDFIESLLFGEPSGDTL